MFQDGREVRTKFSKGIDTTFFPVGGQAETLFRALVDYLITTLGFGPEDPLFPPTAVEVGDELCSSLRSGLLANGHTEKPWRHRLAIKTIKPV